MNIGVQISTTIIPSMTMNLEQIIQKRRTDVRYNTSYPLSSQDWMRYRVDGTLPFENEREMSLYIHVPFCRSLCKFCEYVKYLLADKTVQHRYLDIVENDMIRFMEDHPCVTFTGFDIGGGTPTSLCHSAFQRLVSLLNIAKEKNQISSDFLPSIEATFLTIDEEKIHMIHEAGFRRISFGLQNVNSTFLQNNHRNDGTFARQQEVFKLCHKYGIEILNLDLMYGFVDQRKDDLLATLSVAQLLDPEHLTVYELRTNMLHDIDIKGLSARNAQYHLLRRYIKEAGYDMQLGANTASRISDDGVSSYLHHRMTGNGSYKGFGIAAQSKSRIGLSYNIGKNCKSLKKCLEQDTFEQGGDTYLLPPHEMLAKYLAICGYCGRFRLSKMNEILGVDALTAFHDEFDFLTKHKYLRIKNDIAYLTRKGFSCYGAIFSLFYPAHE